MMWPSNLACKMSYGNKNRISKDAKVLTGEVYSLIYTNRMSIISQYEGLIQFKGGRLRAKTIVDVIFFATKKYQIFIRRLIGKTLLIWSWNV